MLASFPKVPKM